MKRLLALAIIFGLVFRIVPYLTSIFAYGHVLFPSPDSYYQIDLIKQSFLNLPHMIPGALYHFIVAGLAWILSLGHGGVSYIEHFSALFPLLVFVLTAILVYLTAKKIFGPGAAVIAVFAFVLMPGEYQARSILGEIDYHAFEVFLTTATIYCVVSIFQSKGWKKIGWWAGACLALIIYSRVWVGFALLLPFLASFAIPKKRWLGIVLLALSLGILALAAFRYGITGLTVYATAEMQPGFTGMFPTLHILIGIGLLFTKLGGKFRWPLFVWTLLLVSATMVMRRFDYYLIVPIAILIGGFAVTFKKSLVRPLLIFILLVGFLPGYIFFYKPETPPNQWYSALEWVKDNTPENSLVVSWWDYGYWIKYIGKRTPYITPSQESDQVKAVAQWLVDGTPLKSSLPVYLIIDSHMVGDFIPAIEWWAGEKNTFPYVRWIYVTSIPGYNLIYDTKDVKVYEFMEEK
jgi:asparagine N-glycosylation enzyme membrane subunit Stt3